MIFQRCLVVFSIFTATRLVSASWFSSEDNKCACYLADGYRCSIGKSPHGSQSCQDLFKVKSSVVKLSVTCDRNDVSNYVLLAKLMEKFTSLQILHIERCHVNLSSYEILDEASKVERTMITLYKIGSNRVTVRMKTKVNIQRNSTDSRPPCKLIELRIRRTQMAHVPVGFIEKCTKLEVLDFEAVHLSIISDLDFVTITLLHNLRELRLRNNFMSTFSSLHVENTLREIQKFFSDNLTNWLAANNKSLGHNTSVALYGLANKARGLPTSSLSMDSLASLMREFNVPMEFELDKFRLTHLDLSGNNLPRFPKAVFGMRRLRVLYLSNNKIRRGIINAPQNDLFSLSPSVIDMHLQNNNLTTVDKLFFEYLKNLVSLDLSNNSIGRLPADAIPKGMKLRDLKLDKNNLRDLTLAYEMKHLHFLSASNNKIKAVGRSLTSKIPNIRHLSLSHNPFQALESYALVHLRQFYLLDLSYGKIINMLLESYTLNMSLVTGQRPYVNISNNRRRVVCDCKSVFKAMVDSHRSGSRYTIPYLIWSKGQKCDMGAGGIVNISTKISYSCYWTGKHCPSTCRCCDDTQSCDCQLYCPRQCKCKYPNKFGKVDVMCSNTKLKEIPIGMVDASSLDLSGNRLVNIDTRALPKSLYNLQNLHLNKNQIEVIGRSAFQGLEKLHYLDLSENKINRISDEAFSGLDAIKVIYLENNSLTIFKRHTFSYLTGTLSELYLRHNPLHCDCHYLPDFLKFKRQNLNLFIDMPDFCRVTSGDEISVYGDIKSELLDIQSRKLDDICKIVKMKKDTAVSNLRIGLTTTVVILIIIILSVLLSYYRHKLRARLDERILSALARTILRLSTYNTRGGIDVGFLVHERQTEHFYAIRRRLIGTPRQALNIVRIADHMPGSTRLGQVNFLASHMGACVILVSRDLMQDALFMEALRMLLLHNVEARKNGDSISITPILLSRDVKDCPEWSNVDLMLRHYTILYWNQPFFWERLIADLPPPPLSLSSNDEKLGYEASSDRIPPMSRAEIDQIIHLCLISHENQTASQVRSMFDRYRSTINLCHVRHNRLYGTHDLLTSNGAPSLNYVLGNTLQVAVLISEELLFDPWARNELFTSLNARLQALPFKGTIILLEIGHNFAHHCKDGEFQFYDKLRQNALVVTLAWEDVERNWEVLNVHLLPEAITVGGLGVNVTGMDESEFVACLMRPVAQLNRGSRCGCNIFEQHQARWPVHNENEEMEEETEFMQRLDEEMKNFE